MDALVSRGRGRPSLGDERTPSSVYQLSFKSGRGGGGERQRKLFSIQICVNLVSSLTAHLRSVTLNRFKNSHAQWGNVLPRH